MISEVAIILQWALPVIICIFVTLWIAKYKKKSRCQVAQCKFSPYLKYVILCLAIVLITVSIANLYVRGYSWPVGRDAVNYVYTLEMYEHSGVGLDDFLLSYRVNLYSSTLLTFFPFFLFRLFGLNWPQILPIAQVVLSLTYCLIVYVFIKRIIQIDILASCCALLTGVSTFSFMLGVTLNRNLVALIIVVSFWLAYVSWLKSRKNLIFLVSFGLFAFLLVQYQAIAFILALTLVLFVLINKYYREKRLFLQSILFPCYLVLYVVSCDLYDLVKYGTIVDPGLAYPSHLIQEVGIGSDFLFNLFENINPMVTFAKYNNPFLMNFLENPIILFLAIIGLVAIIFRTPIADKKDSKRAIETYSLVLLWSLLVSVAFLLSNMEMNGYRLLLNLPVGIFAGFGLYWLLTKLVNRLRVEKVENV